jgi:hypothetical protein
MTDCDVCRDGHNRIRKAVWSHGKNSDKLCDECYQDTLKWYKGFKRIKK